MYMVYMYVGMQLEGLCLVQGLMSVLLIGYKFDHCWCTVDSLLL